MPLNSVTVNVEDVIRFFEEDIDGMGKFDGFPRNEGVPASIRIWKTASLCELSEDEFQRLIIPQNPHILLRDKRLEEVEGADSIHTVEKYFEQLVKEELLPPLIVRNAFSWDLSGGSFYIEDGAHKALGYKKYFFSHAYKPVSAYVGIR